MKNSSVIRFGLPLLLLVATSGVFGPGLHGGFIFDDFPNLVDARGWRIDSLAWPDLWRAFDSDISGTFGRPLAMLSFGVNHVFSGDSAYWLKLTNLLWHGANGVLVWLLVRQLLACATPDWRHADAVSAGVATLWLLHPLQASTVLYVVQRMEIAAATGILLFLLAYVTARVRQLEARKAWPWLLLSVIAMLLGLGFKETALLCPAYALLLELSIFHFRGARGRISRGWVAVWLGAAVIGVLGHVYMVIQSLQHWPYASRGWGPVERLLTQIPVLAMYVKQIWLPVPENYFFYYDNFPPVRTLNAHVLAAGAVLGMLLVVALACRRRWPLTTLGIGWFFASHFLTSNVWPLELVFEHRNYLALLGLVLAVLQPAAWVTRRLHGDARAVLALLPIVLLASITHIQAKIWADPLQLAWTLENRNPSSQRAMVDLGNQLVKIAQGDASNPAWSLAVALFERAANLPGEPMLPLRALILTLSQANRPVTPGTWDDFRSALTAPGKFNIAHLGAVLKCRIKGRCKIDDNELLQTFISVVGKYPGNPSVLTLYANFAWNILGDRQLAIRIQREAVHLKPGAPQYRIALAKFLLGNGNLEEGRILMAALQEEKRVGTMDTDLYAELADLQRLAQRASAYPAQSGTNGSHRE